MSIRSLISTELTEQKTALDQTTEQIVGGVMTGLDAVNKANIAVNKFVTPRRALGPLGKVIDALPGDQSGFLDTSYHDVRQRVVDYAHEQGGTGWGITADILAPDAIDFVGGIGYWDNIAKGLGRLRKVSSKVPTKARKLMDVLDRSLTSKFGGWDNLEIALDTGTGAGRGLNNINRIIDSGGVPWKLYMAAEQTADFAKDIRRGTLYSRVGSQIDKKLVNKVIPTAKDARTRGFEITDDYYLRNLTGDELEFYKQTSKYGAEGTLTGAMIGKNRGRAPFSPKLSPHHMSELSFDAKTLDRIDSDDLMAGLNQLDIFPGNHPRNFIGMYGDNTSAIQASFTVQLHDLLGGDRSLREVKDFLKKLPEGSDLSAKTLRGKSVEEVKVLISQLKDSPQREWAQFFKGTRLEGQKLGFLKDKINLPKAIFSTEHNDMYRHVINRLPSTLEIDNLVKSGKWQNLSTEQALIKLATNQLHKQNVAMNISLLRLKQIQKSMGKTNGDPNDWIDVMTFMAKNPRKAAMSGWHKRVSKGDNFLKQLGMTQQDLMRDLDPKQAELVARVFGMEQVPQTTGKIRAFLSKVALERKLQIAP